MPYLVKRRKIGVHRRGEARRAVAGKNISPPRKQLMNRVNYLICLKHIPNWRKNMIKDTIVLPTVELSRHRKEYVARTANLSFTMMRWSLINNIFRKLAVLRNG